MLQTETNLDKKMEFSFTDREFLALTKLVYSQTGIVLKESKKNMVYSRLAKRLRALGLTSFKGYVKLLGDEQSDQAKVELGYLINAITTNLTKFFRESHHFKDLLPRCLDIVEDQKINGIEPKLRIWSAGCSSGEEPYSIAMIIREVINKAGAVDAKILATDLDTNMLKMGQAGIYKTQAAETLPKVFKSRYISKRSGDEISVSRELQKLISFKQLNLLDDWPMKKSFDIIFCRNVMIYFDNPTKLKLINKYADLLRPGGALYIGHSESLLGDQVKFKLHGRTIYERTT